MASLKERVTARVERLRERYSWIDHTVRMVQHYGAVNGNAQSGAVTYFGFLSIFPILAIAFFVVGQVAKVYPEITDQMATEINNLLPGVIGDQPGQVPLSTFEDYAGTVGLIGFVGLIYAGLGWLSGMRSALEVMFVLPRSEQPNMVLGKLRDLGTLSLIGAVLMVSVVLSGAVTGFSGTILRLLHIDPSAQLPTASLSLVGHALAITASAVLLMAMFKLLITRSHLPRRALVGGAVLGAVGFELLKLVANVLLTKTQGSPAFQAFGVALILVVWINYFSRLVMYAAAWAYTAPVARRLRESEAVIAPGAVLAEESEEQAPPPSTTATVSGTPSPGASVATRGRHAGPSDHHAGVRRAVAGAAVLAGLVAVAVRRSRSDD